ncbi:transposase [Sphingobacterium athyrii]|uniref:Transposase n=1 Tax=Sphingobacterium athyrii TaxID=2152717 RepID=A0A363NUR0_9SPHI|nr:transposase [Sphingobacterium athyrii]PUV24519.1 transposase [Sphingobacterium athyrii]
MPAFKNIHIGNLINKAVIERGISSSRICNFLKCSEEEFQKMLQCKSLDSETLLRWSKLLEYDFFRIYSQHLILYAPPAANKDQKINKDNYSLPSFRKNIYTKEVINFILELIQSDEKTKLEVMDEYKIPKTTLYKWLSKHTDANSI